MALMFLIWRTLYPGKQVHHLSKNIGMLIGLLKEKHKGKRPTQKKKQAEEDAKGKGVDRNAKDKPAGGNSKGKDNKKAKTGRKWRYLWVQFIYCG